MHWNLQSYETNSNLPGSCQVLPGSPPQSKSLYRKKRAFLLNILSVLMLVENLDITARWDAATRAQGRMLRSALLPPSFVEASPFVVKCLQFHFSLFCGNELCSLGDGEGWRKKRTAIRTGMLKKYKENRSSKDSRDIMTSLIYPTALHTLKNNAT